MPTYVKNSWKTKIDPDLDIPVKAYVTFLSLLERTPHDGHPSFTDELVESITENSKPQSLNLEGGFEEFLQHAQKTGLTSNRGTNNILKLLEVKEDREAAIKLSSKFIKELPEEESRRFYTDKFKAFTETKRLRKNEKLSDKDFLDYFSVVYSLFVRYVSLEVEGDPIVGKKSDYLLRSSALATVFCSILSAYSQIANQQTLAVLTAKFPNDDYKSLFKAITIDKSLLYNRAAKKRIVKAQLSGDKKFFGDTLLSDITPRLLTEYRSMCRGKRLAPSSINQRRTLLRHAFKLAIREWEWVKENPVDRVGREKVNNARDRWLTIDQERKLIESCVAYQAYRGNDKVPTYWLQEIVVFALNTGMRQDEILSLCGGVSHVDLFRRTVTVVRSKNGEKRTIPLNMRVMELLKAKVKGMSSSSDFVFASRAGTKIDHKNLRRAFYEALRRAEIDEFRFHDLRHTFATRLAQAGVDLYKIAKLLGHKDIKMTQRYSHHYPESLRDGVEVLDKISTNLAQCGS